MAQSEEFRRLLTEGIYRISACEAGKPIRVVQDELGYALDKRGGGSALEYWRQGHLPKTADIEKLARELIRRSDLDQTWLAQFLASAAYPHPEALCHELFPQAAPSILQHGAPPAAQHVVDRRSPLSPALLPNKAYRMLIGREALLQEALAALQDRQGRWIITLDGLAGIGKTALARELVALCEKKQIFDDVIWVSAAGRPPWPANPTGAGLTFATLLDTIARHLGAADSVQAEFAEKLMQVQLLLRRRRVLLVLDNLETASEPQTALLAQLQFLLNPSKALCTSRYRFTGDVYAIHLGGLASADALEFVWQEVQERRVLSLAAAADDLLGQLVSNTGGSPLAMKLIIGQASYLPLAVVLQTLRGRGAYPTFPATETDFYQALFGPAWTLLSAPAQELCMALTLFVPGEGGDLFALQTVSGLAADDLIHAIQEGWQLSLLEVDGTSANAADEALRYFLHPLTHHFLLGMIASQAPLSTAGARDGDDPLPMRSAATGYTLYLHNCQERMLGYLLAQIEQYGDVPPPAGTRRLAMYVLGETLTWLALWPLTRRLLLTLSRKMEQSGHRRDWLPYVEQGIEQSRLFGDDEASAALQLEAGMLYQLLGEYSTAADQFAASASGFAALLDHHQQVRALNRWAYVARLQKHPTEALRLALAAMSLVTETDAERGSSYTVLGALALDAHDWSSAVAYFRQSLTLWQHTGNQPMIARRLRDLGSALRAQGNYTEASACYEQALALFAEMQEPGQQAVTQMNLGNIYLERGEPAQALILYRLAEPIFQQTGDEPQLAILYRNLSEAYAKL